MDLVNTTMYDGNNEFLYEHEKNELQGDSVAKKSNDDRYEQSVKAFKAEETKKAVKAKVKKICVATVCIIAVIAMILPQVLSLFGLV